MVLHEMAQILKDVVLQFACSHLLLQAYHLIQHEQEVPVAAGRPYVVQKLIFKTITRVSHELGTVWLRQVNLIVTVQDTQDVVGQFPQEPAKAVERKAVEVHEDTDIGLAQVGTHLVEHRGFARAPLTVEDDHVVTMLPFKRPADEIKAILTAKEHRGASDRVTCNVGVDYI